MSADLVTDAVAHRRRGDARVTRAKAPWHGDSPHFSRPRRVRSRPRAPVMRAPGTNCDRETVIALEMAGADVESVHLERLEHASNPPSRSDMKTIDDPSGDQDAETSRAG